MDDEPTILELLQMRLEMEGHEISSAGDGDSAITAISEHQPDAVLLDLMMPGVDGWAVLKAIKGDDRSKDTKVIILSAKASGEDVERSFQLGADDYLTKPFDLDRISERIQEVIDRSPEQAEARRRQILEGGR